MTDKNTDQTATVRQKAPVTGQVTTINDVLCEIIAVYKFGTMDVKTLDGKANCFRVTGLNFI